MTATTNLDTLDARKGSAVIELADDALSYTCVRVFGAPPDRIYRAFTDPADLRVWFPAGAPPGSELTKVESNPVEGGTYLYEMVIPEYGTMSWHGNYTGVDRPDRIDAEEWFVMGEGGPEGPPSVQSLTFDPVEGGRCRMTMEVKLPSPEDPVEFMEQSAAGLTTSLDAMDTLVTD